MAGRQSVRVIFHPHKKCNERLGFRQALRDHTFKTTTPPYVFSLARDKVILIHFEDPTTGSSAQAINKAATSSSQPGQNRNRGSAVGENNRGDRRHSNLVGNRPQAEANKRGEEDTNKIGRRPDGSKAKNHGDGGARYPSVQVCEQYHHQIPSACKKAEYNLRIDPPIRNNLQVSVSSSHLWNDLQVLTESRTSHLGSRMPLGETSVRSTTTHARTASGSTGPMTWNAWKA